jgi:hypothetical protein
MRALERANGENTENENTLDNRRVPNVDYITSHANAGK